MGAPFTVLQVCMGNICRSPMAERLLVRAIEEYGGHGLVAVHGAGTGGWHAGEPMDPGAARQIELRGGSVDGFLARRLLAEHIDDSDLVLTATAEQVRFVRRLRPDAAARTFALLEFGRLLPQVSTVDLPPTGSDVASVHRRGVALVAAVAAARGHSSPRATDDLTDPWGCDDDTFSDVADQVEATVQPLAAVLLQP